MSAEDAAIGSRLITKAQALWAAAPRRPVRHHYYLLEPASCDQALDAVRDFHSEHERLPRRREWERATSTRPCAKTIERRWGQHELLAEAWA